MRDHLSIKYAWVAHCLREQTLLESCTITSECMRVVFNCNMFAWEITWEHTQTLLESLNFMSLCSYDWLSHMLMLFISLAQILAIVLYFHIQILHMMVPPSFPSWLKQQFVNFGQIFLPDEKFEVSDYVLSHLDIGAMRTIWFYYSDLPLLELEKLFWEFFKLYAVGSLEVSGPHRTPTSYTWTCKNASACAVSLCRHMYYK